LRILLDENVDWRLERDLPGHEVKSVPRIGWAGIENGELIQRAQTQFDVLITMDSRMVGDLNIEGTKLRVIVLKAKTNMLADTRPLMAEVLARLPTLELGTVLTIGS
jgi:predicted nuclease of predicted toxin-antitoxin system